MSAARITPMTTMKARLTKADTVALWHAVYNNMAINVRVMKDMDFTPEQIAAEQALLLRAKRALRKVNNLRKQGL